MTLLRRFADLGIGPDTPLRDHKHVRVINVFCAVLITMFLVWMLGMVLADQFGGVQGNLVALVVFVSAIAVNARGHHLPAGLIALVGGTLAMTYNVTIWGAASDSGIYLASMSIAAFLVLPPRHLWLQVGCAALAGSAYVLTLARPDLFAGSADPKAPLLNGTFSLATLVACGLFFATSMRVSEDTLQEERERSDRLLLNVLPPAIADRLKSSRDPIADHHDEVTVLFADVVGFTPLSARLSPRDVVDLLNDVFTAFDAICERHGVEKIRTIGDGYMVVCGAPEPRADHAAVLAAVAVEMRDHVAARADGPPLAVRIGLNSGPAVAGIVGTSRFHYDIWGDAVNLAARMESHGEPGRIQIARPTWERIHGRFRCTPRGPIEVKGVGPMETWFVEGRA